MKRFLTVILALCLLLPLAAAGEEEGTSLYVIGRNDSDFDMTKTRLDLCYAVEDFFKTPYYIYSSLPKGLSAPDVANSIYHSVSLQGKEQVSGEHMHENADKFRVELVSGDTRLRKAFEFMEWDEDDISICLMYSALQSIHEPTEAEFLFTFESEHFIYQERKTLRLVSIEEIPFYTLPEMENLTEKVGSEFTHSDLVRTLLGDRYQVESGAIEWKNFSQWKTSFFEGQEGISFDPETSTYRILQEGTYTGSMDFRYANVDVHLPFAIEVIDYSISGETSLEAGQTARYTVVNPGDRHFTWSVEGEGAEIDPESGELTVTASASDKTVRFTVLATPDDGATPARLQVTVLRETYQGEPIYLTGNARLSEFAFSGEELDFMMNEPGFFGTTWYSKGDLPESVEWTDPGYGGAIVGLEQKDETGETYEDVKPDKFALEFISGTPELAGVVSLWEGSDGMVILQMNPEGMTVPGSAVFRITLENEKYFYQQEKTLTVESFRDNPPFIVSDVPLIGTIRKGGRISEDGVLNHFLTLAQLGGDIKKAKYNDPSGRSWLGKLDGFERDMDAYIVTQNGVFDFTIPVAYYNVRFDLHCRLISLEEGVYGLYTMAPGESYPFVVQGGTGANYTWSVMGEGASISKEGLLTIDEDATTGTVLMVTATPDDGGTPLSSNVFVQEFGFASATMNNTVSYNGMRAPVLDGKGWSTKDGTGADDPDKQSVAVDSTGLVHQSLVYIRYYRQFFYGEEAVEEYYRNVAPSGFDYESREIRIDGEPAMLYAYRGSDSGVNMYLGQIDYIRNNTAVQMILVAGRTNNESIDNDEPVTLDYLEKVASHIHYDESRANLTYDDVRLTLETDKNAAPAVVAGKKLQLKASFGNPDKVNKKNGNDEILWSITDASGGETTAATISNKGQVTAAKNLEEPVALTVTATAGFFKLKETMEITVIPAVTALTVDPAEINLYEGSDKAETVRATVAPDTIPLNLLSWTLAKEGFAEMTAAEDGAVSLKALKAGKTTVTVTEPGGKKAAVKVNVFVPVEDVELQVTGKQIPGGTVTVKTTISPKNAGKKDLEWSLDVGEDIATVNSKGQVKIAKTAPAGTAITVTCKALGAPEPVVKTVSFEVAEK